MRNIIRRPHWQPQLDYFCIWEILIYWVWWVGYAQEQSDIFLATSNTTGSLFSNSCQMSNFVFFLLLQADGPVFPGSCGKWAIWSLTMRSNGKKSLTSVHCGTAREKRLWYTQHMTLKSFHSDSVWTFTSKANRIKVQTQSANPPNCGNIFQPFSHSYYLPMWHTSSQPV